MRNIEETFRSLRKTNGREATLGVYIHGRPGFGKTQLAREYGKMHFQSGRGRLFKKQVVATLNATNRSSFFHAYLKLAMELELVDELQVLDKFSGFKGELHALELISAAVRKELRKRPNWLLIVDNLSSEGSFLTNRSPTEGADVCKRSSPTLAGVETVEESLHNTDSPMMGSAHASLGLGASQGGEGGKNFDWRGFCPHPGDESWGRGHVLITTRDGRLVERSNPAVGTLELNDGLHLDDAVSLLERVSGVKGEGAEEVVIALERVPLSVAR